MADIGINYDAYTQPSSVGVELSLSFAGATLQASVANIDDFIIRLTPAGNVSEEILSGVAWPIAQLLGATLPPLAKSLVDGVHFDVVTVAPFTHEIAGEAVSITPSNLSLANYNGLLMVQGAVSVSLQTAS